MSEADPKSPRRWTRRPLFAPSQLLTAQQLNALIDGQRAQLELLMRGLHGHGVVFGYAVALPGAKRKKTHVKQDRGARAVEISCGMALDRHGRVLRWPGGLLDYGEIANRNDCPGTYTLSVHYAQRKLPKGGCGPCGDDPEWIEEGVVFTLTDGCAPADRACPDAKGKCVSLDDYVCFRTGSASGPIDPAPDLAWACEDSGPLCRIACSDAYYDPLAGVPIACVSVANLAIPDSNCDDEWGFAEVGQSCEIRPRVYRTPLLYELIRGCQDNLAKIAAIGWQDWLLGFPGEPSSGEGEPEKPPRTWDNPVPWGEFAGRFVDKEQLWVKFTRPIDVTTVHAASMFLTATWWDRDDEYVLTRRVPTEPPEPIDEKNGYAAQFRLCPHEDWIDNAVNDESSTRDGGTIELTIRGQMLRDECGNMLNAVPLHYAPKSPAQARPGGDFAAVFLFLSEAEEPDAQPRRQKKTKLLPAPDRQRRIF